MNPRLEARRKWFRLAAYSSLIILSAGLLSLWSVSYFKNSRAIATVKKEVNEYRKIPAKPADPDEATRMIVKRLDALVAARQVYAEHLWYMGFGLYQGDKVRAGVDEVYEQRLAADLLPEIKRRLEQQMRETLARGGEADTGWLYEMLRTYLMLALPDRMNAGLAESSIRDLWERLYPREPQFQKQLGVHSDALVKALHTSSSVDQTLVDNVRQRLESVPLATQLYNQLKSVALADHSNDFRLMDAIPRISKNVFATVDGKDLETISIPGFFTLQGYDAYFRKRGMNLVEQAMKENWVLNQYSGQKGNISFLYDDLQRQYFAEYALLWHKLLSNLNVKKPQGVFETIQILDQLSGPDTPLRSLLQAVEKNTNLAVSSSGSKQSGPGEKFSLGVTRNDADQISSDPVLGLASSFRALNALVETVGQAPPPIESVLKAAGEVRDLLMQITSGASNEEQALKFARERMNGSEAKDVLNKANLEFARLPEPLHGWLNMLTSSSWAITLKNAKSELNNMWQTEVLKYYTASLDGRYPLVRSSRSDAAMADFCRFFAPNGILDQFFNTYLKSFVDTNTWTQATMNNQGIQLSPQVLRQLKYAAKVREAFFSQGQTTPNIQFQLKPVELDPNVASFRINIEGQTDEYAHGPVISSKFQWPGPSPDQGVILSFMTVDGKSVSNMEEGAWDLFRVLQKSKLEQTSLPDVFRLTFQIEGYSAKYELRASSVFNPFYLPEMQQFHCPGAL